MKFKRCTHLCHPLNNDGAVRDVRGIANDGKARRKGAVRRVVSGGNAEHMMQRDTIGGGEKGLGGGSDGRMGGYGRGSENRRRRGMFWSNLLRDRRRSYTAEGFGN